MKASKKSLLLVIISIALCLVITGVELLSSGVFFKQDDTFEPLVTDFELRYPHLERTRKLAEDYFADKDVNVKERYLTLGKNAVSFLDPATEEITYVPITVYQHQSAVLVQNLIQLKYSLKIVQVEDEQISFQIPEGTYALIHSEAEEAPKTMVFQGKTVRIKTKELWEGWYHAVPK